MREGDEGYDPYDFTSSEEEDGVEETSGSGKVSSQSHDQEEAESMDTEGGGASVALAPDRSDVIIYWVEWEVGE